MTVLQYNIKTNTGSLRIVHVVVVYISGQPEAKAFSSTRAKEVLEFARPYIRGRYNWRNFKNAIRLQQPFTLKYDT